MLSFGTKACNMTNEGPSNAANLPGRGPDAPATAYPDQIQSAPAIQTLPSERTKVSNAYFPPNWHDLIQDPDRPVKGWPKVALLMAKTPEFAAFDRFRDLNTKSLLYYQTQLTLLRKKLHELEYQDHLYGDGKQPLFAKHADLLVEAEEDSSLQWKLVLEIRSLLKEYSQSIIIDTLFQVLIAYKDKALLRFSRISALPEPDNFDMKSFRDRVRDPSGGDFCIAGDGEQHTWGDIYDDDEMELSGRNSGGSCGGSFGSILLIALAS
jgi:hypothetical protein